MMYYQALVTMVRALKTEQPRIRVPVNEPKSRKKNKQQKVNEPKPRKKKKKVIKTKLTTMEHTQIMESWGVVNSTYKNLLERYNTYKTNITKFNKKKKSTQQKKELQKFKDWTPTDRENSQIEKDMQRPSKKAQVLLFDAITYMPMQLLFYTMHAYIYIYIY